MTRAQKDMIERLRDDGYAIVIWTPEELAGADPERVEELMIE